MTRNQKEKGNGKKDDTTVGSDHERGENLFSLVNGFLEESWYCYPGGEMYGQQKYCILATGN